MCVLVHMLPEPWKLESHPFCWVECYHRNEEIDLFSPCSRVWSTWYSKCSGAGVHTHTHTSAEKNCRDYELEKVTANNNGKDHASAFSHIYRTHTKHFKRQITRHPPLTKSMQEKLFLLFNVVKPFLHSFEFIQWHIKVSSLSLNDHLITA